ncbi:MAG: ArnT family glycosyltransferase [Acidobacteriaceae bacterium]
MTAESRAHRWQLALLWLTICLLALRLWHIRADFPDFHFYSQERARFTDEGFYTSAALHYFTLGHAYIPGSWNPGVFMPVWPLLVGLVFHFTGISVVAARSLAVACTWVGVLLAYAVARQYRSRTFACLTAFLMAASALGFFYGRLAILEPSFVMFLLLAMYLAGKAKPGNYLLAGVVGLVFVVTTLTKTTAPFLLPAVLYPMWARNRANRVVAWRMLAVSLAVILLLLGCAKLVWMLHYAPDSRIILALKPWWQLKHSPVRLLRFFFRGTWIDPVLFPLALAFVVAAAWRLRSFWHDTLFVTAFLWEAGYAAFIAFHYDGPPRYFVTLIAPTIWLAMMFLEWMWQANKRIALAASACVAVSMLWNIASIGDYLMRPRYSLLDASVAIKQVIVAEHKVNPAQSELLIGRGADEISLLSGGMATIDSDGAMPLAEKLDVDHPGWFMDFTGGLPTLRMETVAAHRRLVMKVAFPELDRYRNAGIVLHQIVPRGSQ